MKYLALVYYNERIMQEMSQTEWDGLNRQCIGCVEDLSASGHFITGAPLLSTETATTVRVRNGKTLITDGPFAETKEQLAGFYMLEIPPARYGSVEIRPVRELMGENNSR
jgi:hypothetical protein